MKEFELIVYNRWGEQLFISQDISTGWDGNNQETGKKLPEGPYVYSLKGTTIDEEKIDLNGIINLIR